jgi:hypothetical protein
LNSRIVQFWKKVKIIYDLTSCWEWLGVPNTAGYGKFMINGKRWSSHRLIYKMFYKDFNKDLFVLHKCDNRKCVRPSHLFQGTNKDNMDDMCRKNRQARLRGELNGNSKLSNKEIAEIRNICRGKKYGMYKKLSEKYGVLPDTISSIVNRRYRIYG